MRARWSAFVVALVLAGCAGSRPEGVEPEAKIDPNASPAALIALSDSALAMAEPALARRALERAASLAPKSAEVRLGYGRFYTAIQRYKDAKTEFERAESLDPSSPEPAYGLGLAYLKAGQQDLAFASLSRALRIDPMHAGARSAIRPMLEDRYRRAGVPAEYASIPERSSVSRGELGVILAVEAGLDPDRVSFHADAPYRVDWPAIDDVARAAAYPGFDAAGRSRRLTVPDTPSAPGPHALRAREVILGRRSAVSFDPRGTLPLDAFLAMLRRVRPSAPPWDAIDWPPAVHLVLFVHRVEGLEPGVYAFLRDAAAESDLRAAMRPEFLWERVHAATPDLFLLLPTDVTWVANRLSCDQDIAGEGFFSLGMLARFEPLLAAHGDWMYRRLFWECGLIGQVLYLEAEAAGVRGTGIGCFYDDPVHEALGLSGHAWQSLYHFCVGEPIEDTRLETSPGYEWENPPP